MALRLPWWPPDEPDPSDEREPQAERLLEDWHLRATAAQFGHQARAEKTRLRSIQLGLPVVILTTLVGTSAFATFGDATSNEAKLLVGTVSILAAVLAGIQTFLGYSQVAERHRIAATRYATLRRRDRGRPHTTRRVLPRFDQGRDGQGRRASPQIGIKVWEESIVAAKQDVADWGARQSRYIEMSERTSPPPREGRKVAPRQ